MVLPVCVLIPALNPEPDFVDFIRNVAESGVENVIVVNDGSRLDTRPIFDALRGIERVHVLTHAVNLGKGRALKTGINFFLHARKEAAGIVTADADGQHSVADILAVAQALVEKPSQFVLGARAFKGNVPIRSLVGNRLTKFVYAALIGTRVSDTQSGLRGLPIRFLPPLLKTAGEGYEYEMNMLIQCKVLGISIREVPIQTIYIEGNRSSHFNPFLDSMKIYFLLLRFVFSSLSSSLVDFVIFAIAFKFFTSNILYCLIAARTVASAFNFLVNRHFVFHIRTQGYKVFLKYYALVGVLMSFAYLMMREMTEVFSSPVLLNKVLVESFLFIVSFTIQRDFIFNQTIPEDDVALTDSATSA